MEIARLILDYLRALLSWPAAATVIALVFFKLFKNPISDFLRRMVRGEAYGVRVEAATPSEQVKEVQQTQDLPKRDQIEEWIANNPQQVLREYQRAFNAYFFERSFNLIYGSQIALLQHLESKGAAGDKYVNLVAFYNEFIRRSGLASTQFADYIGYLRTSGFVEVFWGRARPGCSDHTPRRGLLELSQESVSDDVHTETVLMTRGSLTPMRPPLVKGKRLPSRRALRLTRVASQGSAFRHGSHNVYALAKGLVAK